MLVVGAVIQIVAFLVEFIAPPFPAFALSFTLAGIGNVFQVNVIYIDIELQLIISLLTRSSLQLRMPSPQLFNLITNRVIYRLHMVHLSLQYSNSTLTYFIQFIRRWRIGCSPICHILCSINNILVASLSYLAFTGRFECSKSCRSF